MFKNKKPLFLLTTAVALGTGVMTVSHHARADLVGDQAPGDQARRDADDDDRRVKGVRECKAKADSTRCYDKQTQRCAWVSKDTPNWKDVPGNWNNRADEFLNDAHRNNCLYQNNNYKGTSKMLKRGQFLRWSNAVSSNRFTTASKCPRH